MLFKKKLQRASEALCGVSDPGAGRAEPLAEITADCCAGRHTAPIVGADLRDKEAVLRPLARRRDDSDIGKFPDQAEVRQKPSDPVGIANIDAVASGLAASWLSNSVALISGASSKAVLPPEFKKSMTLEASEKEQGRQGAYNLFLADGASGREPPDAFVCDGQANSAQLKGE